MTSQVAPVMPGSDHTDRHCEEQSDEAISLI